MLSTLLPWLEAKHAQRPDVVVGTSVGALNAAYIAAHPHEGMAKLAEQARQTWETISYRDVLEPLLSVGELTTFGRLAISLAFRGIVPYSLLDPAPLATTLSRLIKCGDIHNNIAHKELRTCAVVATVAHTNRSVVFHDGGANPPSDERRGIDYVPTEISEDHVRASAAIPIAFPAVHVAEPKGARGFALRWWHPLEHPHQAGSEAAGRAAHLIGLNSVGPRRSRGADRTGYRFDGASQVIQGLLVDPVVNDVETLATINETLIHGGTATGQESQRRVVPYIFVAPKTPNRIGEIAAEVYDKHYSGLRGIRRSPDLALLGAYRVGRRLPLHLYSARGSGSRRRRPELASTLTC